MVGLSKAGVAGGRTVVGGGSDGQIVNGRFHTPFGDSVADVTEADMGFIMPFAATLKNFYVLLWNDPGVGSSWTFTIRENGADTALTVTIADTDMGGEDTTHTVSVQAGSWITISVAMSGEPGATEAQWGFEVA